MAGECVIVVLEGTVNNQIVSTLNDLIETSRDGEKGFALAAKDSKEPELTAVFVAGAQSCRAAIAELQGQVRELGATPEEGGSAKGAVHRGWVSLKSTVTSRDSKAILEECERGEDYAKARQSRCAQSSNDSTRALLRITIACETCAIVTAPEVSGVVFVASQHAAENHARFPPRGCCSQRTTYAHS